MLKENKDNLIIEIFEQVNKNKKIDIAQIVSRFCITTKSVYAIVQGLIKDKKIVRLKKGFYNFVNASYSFTYTNKGLDETRILVNDIQPKLPKMSENAFRAFAYVFTEIFNNAIEHSESNVIITHLIVNCFKATVFIIDEGIGIFEKIRKTLNLDEKRYAILELAKGKFTSDPKSHSGEGIFFSSKIADSFIIMSENLNFVCDQEGKEPFLIEEQSVAKKGTAVSFIVHCNHKFSPNYIFEQYTLHPDDFGFKKTIIPVSLLGYGESNPYFVSRSQARRLLLRFEKFENILLDFEGIDEIGQAFADEIFRVFSSDHPNTSIRYMNCSEKVLKMIDRVRGSFMYYS